MLDPCKSRALHESLYGCLPTPENISVNNGDVNVNQQQPPPPPLPNQPTANRVSQNVDDDLAMALRISELEQQQLQDDLKREQEMLEEVLRLSLEEK